ncbi:MAG: response regulator [Ginsengibacter sp.]
MKRILVVNNDIDTMTLLKTWLEKKAYLVQYTGDQEKVDQIMKKFSPELVIVDILQKDVVKQLKDQEKTSSIPVLLMTGYTLREHQNDVPADDTIEKPFNLSLMERKIENLTNGIAAH